MIRAPVMLLWLLAATTVVAGPVVYTFDDPQLEQAVVDRFINDGPIYRQNTCRFLLAKKGVLSGLSMPECQV